MKSEGLVLYSQEPATGPYLVPNESSRPWHILFHIHFNIILSSTPSLWSGVWSYQRIHPSPKPCV